MLKGVLVILVIFGHAIPGAIDSVFSRYFIYSFHMPLFMGISGYLFSLNKAAAAPLKVTVKKYWSRVGIPYAAAVIIYFFINIISYPIISSLKNAPKWYHLWFIVAWLFYIFFTFFLSKKLSLKVIFFIYLGIYLIASIFNNEIYQCGIFGVSWIFDALRPWNMVYFAFGLILKDIGNIPKKGKQTVLILAPVLIVAVSILFFYPMGAVVSSVVKLALNLTLLLAAAIFFNSRISVSCRPLEEMGKGSLFFYLWHMLFVLALRKICNENTLLMLGFTALFTAVMYLIYYVLKDKKYFRLLLAGR